MARKKKAAGTSIGTRAAMKAARSAGRATLKGGKAQAKPVRQTVGSQGSAGPHYLRYGFFALVGFTIGALIARAGNKDGASSSFTGGTGHDSPDPGSPAGQRGETWGSGTPVGGTGPGGGAQDADLQRPEDPNRTGAERDYSDPSTGPLIGRSHRDRIGDIPVQHEEVENRIRTRVGEDPRTLGLQHLNVEVNGDIADIRGVAPSENAKEAVSEIAASVEGVREVRNYLTINP